ncbi:hypothetical protein N7499_008524 [Penicillium canescens]|uniref:Kynurenine formamidase n=1 Tax=Penicillium canescens TaxID=5083 RepID=A0AAD6N2D3_PENCN|nr:uncharacterized protein N7446_013560 [Penicillium canescens]KAJ6023200.1 hypothetical protein N7460_013595 [Penicillium canescens]KAJ6025532.1 hypothetical protein N7444_013211 [Penicillium canescens]KAJ6042494.1 hypothetical protein N7446_013560 [Penicillium canescens]KAJ6076543.1 hypothetical protein N7499_008524 [Penicillium canescens]KAJ6158851.1 hypothetical protein N7485_011677 [Penicillium canescens]
MPNQPAKTVTYGRVHDLQHISVTTLDNTDGYWVIYIHGGAWRDPTVTADSFKATQEILRKTPGLPIAGIASISYRLSAHPNHPQDPTSTGPKEFRDAKHPDHIRDVEAALAFLQNTYIFGARYILVGHSCGATLAFQAVMGAVAGHREQAFKGDMNKLDISVGPVSTSPGPLPPRLTVQPIAIVGVAGIYDLRRLRDMNAGISAYREFIEGAFGADELLWDAVSPAQMAGSRGVEGGWRSGRLAVLAQSEDDELVDASQVEAMEEVLRRWEKVEAQIPAHELSTKDRRVRVLPISGAHDEAWEKGDQLARAVIYAFEELQAMNLTPRDGTK